MIGDEVTQPFHPPRCARCKLETEASTPFCARCKLDLRYGSPGSVKKGPCIYCGETRQFSAEHIYGKWLRERYGGLHTRTRHTLSRPARVAFWESVPVHRESVDSQGTPFDKTVLNVCETCNNGWMSRLHVLAAPFIETLADREWPDFSDEQRDLVARWVLMVSINLECYGRIPQTTQQQRTLLMGGVMPPGCRISVAHMEDASCSGLNFFRPVLAPIDIGAGKHLPIQSTYFCVGRVAFHTLMSLGDSLLSVGLLAAGPKARLPRMIWPTLEPLTAETRVLLRTSDDLDAVQQCFGPV
jgi:hypothetical protein